jgi:tetratricopeptide (TPR) repeat protein
VSGRRTAVSIARRPGRNDPCICGSGRKFKLCCGAAPVTAGNANSQTLALLPRSAAPDAGERSNSLGPLTEVSRLRETAEEFMRMQSGLPAAPGLTGGAAGARHRVTPDQRAAARRYRERGISLVETGRLSAAISAFRRAIELDPGEAASHHALGRALLRLNRLAEAAASLSLATTLKDDAAAYHDLGMALHRQGLYVEATAAYRRAVELAPELAEAHAALGDLLDLADEDEEAAQCFRRAAAAAPDTVAGRWNLAKACMLEANFSEAEVQLRQALACEPQNDGLMKYLGDVLARQGRFVEAGEAFDRTLELNPRHVAAHFTIVEARKCTEADRPRLGPMLAALDDAGLGDGDRVQLHFAIGKLLDDLGDYAEAMRHFDMANQLRRAEFDGAEFSACIDRLVQRFTPGFFAANSAFGRDDETPLMIVGLPRSGTTLVEQIISSHPQVAAGGEQPFWVKRASPWGIADASYLSTGMAHDLAGEYLGQLRRIGPAATRIIDKQPFNLLYLGIIHLLLPKARIIQCRRHPVDTCLSIYFTNFRQVIGFSTDKADLADGYRIYARLMDHWRAVLPSDRFFEVDYEELIADREAVTRRLVAFSGLDWCDSCLQPERNNRAVVTASLWQARQPVYATSVGRWRHYEPWLGELRRLLPADRGDEPAAAS